MRVRLLGTRAYTRRKSLLLKAFILTAVLGICLQFVSSFILSAILDMMPKVREEYLSNISSLTDISLITVLYVAILAPLLEEVFFRGIVWFVLDKFLPPAAVIIFQALLFGIYHGNIVQAVYGFILGLLIGCIRRSSGNIISTFILHMFINAAGLMISCIPALEEAGTASRPMLICAFGAALIGLITAMRLVKIWNYTENADAVE